MTWKRGEISELPSAEIGKFESKVQRADIEHVLVAQWEEHCVECAPPSCYSTCPKFIIRPDRRCSRFRYGIVDNNQCRGLFDYAAEIVFEDWAKLECRFRPGFATFKKPAQIRRLNRFANRISYFSRNASEILNLIFPFFQLNDVTTALRRGFIRRKSLFDRQSESPDAFIFECFSFENYKFEFNLNCVSSEKILAIQKLEIVPGQNYFEIPANEFNLNQVKGEGSVWLQISPQFGKRPKVGFSWLHFVKVSNSQQALVETSAQKVKRVAWDLDNTIWDSVLIESEKKELSIKKDARELIHELDRKGIIQTVVSKNSHDEAWAMLEEKNLSHFFVYPAINWGSKSQNLKEIASKLNISLNSFALVDDSDHERAEVEFALPMVRVFSDVDIPTLNERDEFDVAFDAMGTKRRETYQQAEKRGMFEAKFSDNYFDFLRSLDIEVFLSHPKEQEDIDRCLDLIQRSNQLNLTTKRYNKEQFESILQDSSVVCFAIRAKNKFGDYRIIGFVSIDLDEGPLINNMVISCRIAKKRVEHAVLHNCISLLRDQGFLSLEARLIETKKNGPLTEIFDDMPFEKKRESGEIVYTMTDLDDFEDERIITVYRKSNLKI